jgi:hypothetical protein
MRVGCDIARWVALLSVFFYLGLILWAGEVPIKHAGILAPKKEHCYLNECGEAKEYQYASGTAW